MTNQLAGPTKDRAARIEAYLERFDALPPEEQRVHFSIALGFVARALKMAASDDDTVGDE